MVDRLRQYVSFLALTFWLGGLTFYSLIVVPTGAEVVGRTEQGFVTSAVTLKLNLDWHHGVRRIVMGSDGRA
jgi:hypothetical protein